MNLSFASGLDSGSSDLKNVGADERGSGSYPYLDVVEADVENDIPVPYAPLRETEESNGTIGTIDVLSYLPSPLAMLLSPNIPRIESPTNSIGAEQESTCGTLVLPDQKKGGLPAYFLKGQPALPSHRSNKLLPILQYTDKGADMQKFQMLLADNGRSSIVSSQQLAQSEPQRSKILQHINSSPPPSTSFGNHTLCRSLTCSWSGSQTGSSPYRPFRGTSGSLCIWW